MDTTPTINAIVATADGLRVGADSLERQAATMRSQATLLYREVSRLRHPAARAQAREEAPR